MNLLQAVQEATEPQERYHEYILRRSREDRGDVKSVTEAELEVAQLKERIKKLEIDMAHVHLEEKQFLLD